MLLSRFSMARRTAVLTGGLVFSSLLAASASFADATSEPQAEAKNYSLRYREVQRAILVFKQGKHDEAERLLAEAKSLHTELPPVNVMMARLYLSANEMAKAESSLEQAVIEASEDPEAFVLFGDLALRAKHFAFAEMSYDRAMVNLNEHETLPDRERNLKVRILAGLASVAESRGRPSDAIEHLAAWLKIDPKSPMAYGSLGRVQFKANNYDESRAAFAQLAEIAPSAPPVEIAMGRLFTDAGMDKEAQVEMLRATEKYADEPRALLTVCEWALNNGIFDLAEQTVAKSLELDPESLAGRILLARLTRYNGEYSAAEAQLSKLLPIWPNSGLLADEFARTLAESDDDQKRTAALQHAERNYAAQRKANSPITVQAIVTYALALHKNDQIAKAAAVAQSLPDGSSISNENGYYVADIFASRGKTDVAIKMLQSLLATDRDFPMRDQAEELLATLSQS